ncbi:MAG TPA: hypothetical protein PKW90_26295, partial [Myxococcota bacterium]|nr:hypothetical protein [Myxococcota bacterium]
ATRPKGLTATTCRRVGHGGRPYPQGMRILPILLLPAALPAFACGVCGCSTHTDWASQGLWRGPGFRFDLRADFAKQDQLRSGTRALDRDAFPLPAGEEVQVQTLNRNLTLGLDWSPTADWGFTLALPLVHRTHETYAEGDAEVSSSRHSGLGDVRLVGRYLGISENRSFGLQVGVKLATGNHEATFHTGPQAGEPVDRGLQAGTGTTDLILGAFAFGELAPGYSGFAQVQWLVPTSAPAAFRPGNTFTFVAGLRREGSGRVTPQLQLNGRVEKPETGTEADAANSGATLAYLSPGLEVKLGSQVGLTALVQIPVYQRVSGIQIQPRYLASLSLHVAF